MSSEDYIRAYQLAELFSEDDVLKIKAALKERLGIEAEDYIPTSPVAWAIQYTGVDARKYYDLDYFGLVGQHENLQFDDLDLLPSVIINDLDGNQHLFRVVLNYNGPRWGIGNIVELLAADNIYDKLNGLGYNIDGDKLRNDLKASSLGRRSTPGDLKLSTSSLSLTVVYPNGAKVATYRKSDPMASVYTRDDHLFITVNLGRARVVSHIRHHCPVIDAILPDILGKPKVVGENLAKKVRELCSPYGFAGPVDIRVLDDYLDPENRSIVRPRRPIDIS